MQLFLFNSVSIPALGPTQPPITWVLGALIPAVRQLGHETDHSSPSSAEVKNAWNYTTTLLTLSSWYDALIKQEIQHHGAVLS
jgi:fatty acid desaturase